MDMNVRDWLFENRDPAYIEYQSKVTPNVNKETFIGVRTPVLRRLAKQLIKKEPQVMAQFLKDLPHTYFEENQLHAVLLSDMKDFEAVVAEVNRFLPYVDNWGTCDTLVPKIFNDHLAELEPLAYAWIQSDQPYTIRFGISMFMSFFLGPTFKVDQAEAIAALRSDEYYVNMMIAWYFATALAFNYEDVVPFLTEKKLDVWTHNKSIQKGVESRRLTDEQKVFLKSLRLKDNKIREKK
ncbi:MAG: DNA alkylation repair protein [Veillonella sp.]|uniref:DNA alkylation repair protein n=1 Tax=Veillonella sp. TaxID=1926307 RepID=UPI0025CCDC4E|nr:DNA alkylation repair protein [Veillonella sp.]MBS4913385.1 DNA alkylation repair protein [Veillonella sp.]